MPLPLGHSDVQRDASRRRAAPATGWALGEPAPGCGPHSWSALRNPLGREERQVQSTCRAFPCGRTAGKQWETASSSGVSRGTGEGTRGLLARRHLLNRSKGPPALPKERANQGCHRELSGRGTACWGGHLGPSGTSGRLKHLKRAGVWPARREVAIPKGTWRRDSSSCQED